MKRTRNLDFISVFHCLRRRECIEYAHFISMHLPMSIRAEVFVSNCKQWLCSHGLESRSERRFGTRSKTWLGSWFELHAFTWATNAFPITIRICVLRVIFCSYYAVRARWLTHALKQRTFQKFQKSFAFTWSRIRLSRRITIQNAICLRFKTRFKRLIWNSFAFTWAKIRLSNQERAESRFETSFGTWF